MCACRRLPRSQSEACCNEQRSEALQIGDTLVGYVWGMSDVLEETDLGEAPRRNEGDPNRVLLVRG
jgi:hypothetical protein